MTYLSSSLIESNKKNLITDISHLGRIYKSRKSEYDKTSIRPSELSHYEKNGYEIVKSLKTKISIQRKKEHSHFFEDEIWCLMYELGFRILNKDETFRLKYGTSDSDLQQIDVVAINDEVAILIECKSSEKPRSISYKTFLEGTRIKQDGFRKSINDLVGKRRIKYILATRNQKIGDEDKKRMENEKIFHLDDNAFSYIKSLNKKYGKASLYQFLGLVYKKEIISNDPIDVPALQGKMGGKTYYMFSIEPIHLLKTGFILHRTRVNEMENPTYQRLLIPSRLKGISKFINDGGFFPNSIIVNFNTDSKVKLSFDVSSSKNLDSNSRHGVLKIPNMYAIAYIIDGQHRLYGFSNTEYVESSTIPVVAFENLTSDEQLEMFLDINENQKKISPSLKLTLQEDINWNNSNVISRMKALRSGIINKLADDVGPLNSILSVGEDKKELSPNYIDNALRKSKGFLPKTIKGNHLKPSDDILYNVYASNSNDEMLRVKKYVSDMITITFMKIDDDFPNLFSDSKSYVRSNRGIYAIIYVIGSLNVFLTSKGHVDRNSSVDKRLMELWPYLKHLFSKLEEFRISEDDPMGILKIQGQQAEKSWSMFFESIINQRFEEFYTEELQEFQETQDKSLQHEAKILVDNLEKIIKTKTLNMLKDVFGDSWDLEITEIKTKCQTRATEEQGIRWKDDGIKVDVKWTDMFDILDYYKISFNYWTKKGESSSKSFQDIFSIKTDETTYKNGKEIYIIGKDSNKKTGLKWMKSFNNYRRTVSHSGSKSYGLNRSEVEFVKMIINTLDLS